MSALAKGITSKNDGNFCLNCFHSYSTKDKLKQHKLVCENHDYCYVEMPKENNESIEKNGEKSWRHGEKAMEKAIKSKPWRKIYENSIYY